MKVAIMGRTLDDEGGIYIATSSLMDTIIELDRETEYVVLYRTRREFGRYRGYSHVKELLFWAPTKLLWDQLLVPYYARREGVDVILNPKFTVPLLSGRPTVAICQGTEYYTLPQFYSLTERLHARTLMPLYYGKASRVITVSDDVQHDLHRYLGVPYERMETVYLAPGEQFYPRTDRGELEAFRLKHGLPQTFVVAVTRGYQDGRLYPRKNIDNVLRAFLTLKDELPDLRLVFAGTDIHRYVSTVFGREVADDPRLVYVGWLARDDMPLLYSLARALLFPSYSESYGLPIAEAMACGCPVITSTGGACPEIAGDAALIVDPTDIEGLATGIRRVVTDAGLSQTLTRKGLRRAREFSWARSAQRVIEVCREIVHGADGGVVRKTSSLSTS